jgi:hypothetical protein
MRQLKNLGIQTGNTTPFDRPGYANNIRKALARTFVNQTAIKSIIEGHNIYRTIHARQDALIDQDSVLVDAMDDWIVYNTFGEYGGPRTLGTVKAFEPQWLDDIPYFIKRKPRLEAFLSTLS